MKEKEFNIALKYCEPIKKDIKIQNNLYKYLDDKENIIEKYICFIICQLLTIFSFVFIAKYKMTATIKYIQIFNFGFILYLTHLFKNDIIKDIINYRNIYGNKIKQILELIKKDEEDNNKI
jgi:hypothetical protein